MLSLYREHIKLILRGVKFRIVEKEKQHNAQKTKGQTAIYKTLHRKLKIEQHEPHKKLGMNSGAPEG